MKVKRSIIQVFCRGCFSILQAEKDDIKYWGVAGQNSYIECPICGMKIMIAIDGEIQKNVKIRCKV